MTPPQAMWLGPQYPLSSEEMGAGGAGLPGPGALSLCPLRVFSVHTLLVPFKLVQGPTQWPCVTPP